jgi:hypothetical protein
MHTQTTVRQGSKAARRPSQVYRRIAPDLAPAARSKPADIALIALFLVMIALPLLGMILDLDSSFVLDENRVLAPRPEVKLDRASLGAFPQKLEAYFNDHFGLRQRLIHWLSMATVKGLCVSSSRHVALGRQGWLYLAGDRPIQYYRGLRPFTTDQLERYRQTLEARRDWLAGRGIHYLFVILPNKDTVYPDFMPREYTKVQPRSRCDQLIEFVKAHSNVRIVDVRDAMRVAKEHERVYDMTDTHWNPRGAFVAYRRIIEELSAWFPDLEAQPRSSFRDVETVQPGGDLARTLGLVQEMPEWRLGLERIGPRQSREMDKVLPRPAGFGPGRIPIATVCADTKLPRALMFHDSFAVHLVPFLSEHFERIVYYWHTDFDRAVVEREHPDVVIHEIVERTLTGEIPADH